MLIYYGVFGNSISPANAAGDFASQEVSGNYNIKPGQGLTPSKENRQIVNCEQLNEKGVTRPSGSKGRRRVIGRKTIVYNSLKIRENTKQLTGIK
jgi:hypothetical protein